MENKMEYQTVNGTSYHKETSQQVINILETARINKTRLKFYYGDINTGKSWLEENDIYGTIGRSTGTNKIPLLIKTAKSFGGGAILDHCIIKIVDTKTKKVLYSHSNFHIGQISYSNKEGIEVYIDGSLQARFKNIQSAKRYISKIS